MSDSPKPSMTIGTLAQAAGMHIETIRYYQRRGLVPVPEKPYGGIRRYQENTLARLGFIRTAQGLGFSLEEVGELLTLDDGAHCRESRVLGERKLANVREKIAHLKQIEGVLARLVAQCSAQNGDLSCPLIGSLHQGIGHQGLGKA